MKILSINTSLPKKINFKNKIVNTSIFKEPKNNELSVTKNGLDGDRQADLLAHGGVNKAIYAYSYKHYEYWGNFLRKDFSEEYGLVGGLFLISIYVLLLLRVVIISNKSNSIFGTLVVIGLGVPIVFQAFVNIGVSVELFPVTGQPLPLISSGGTSIWMTCIAIGIIQSVMNGQKISPDIDDSDNPLEILKQAV